MSNNLFHDEFYPQNLADAVPFENVEEGGPHLNYNWD